MARSLSPIGFAALALLPGRLSLAQDPAPDAIAAERLWLSRVDALAPPASLWLRVRARHVSEEDERRATFAGLELGGRLDALLGMQAEAPVAMPLSISPAVPAPGGRALARQPASQVPPELGVELSRAVIAKTSAVIEASTRPARLDSMASRARAAAALPELRLGAGTSEDESLRFAPTVADPARFTRDGGRDLWFEARLTWQLDRALFARDELAIERARADAEERKQRTVHTALAALEQWQRAWLAQRSELATSEEIDKALLAEVAAAAQLDAFTGGWFSRWLAAQRERSPLPREGRAPGPSRSP